jgi:hypothetical protein
MTTLPDALPGLDDLDDLTLHEPVTKESDMNEARASERADLVELRIGSYGAAYDGPDVCRAYTYKHQPGNPVAYRLGAVTVGCRTVAGGDHIDYGLSLLKLLEDAGFGVFDLRAELSRASATAQEPADTKAVMEEFSRLLIAYYEAVVEDAQSDFVGGDDLPRAYFALESFVQHLASRASPSQPAERGEVIERLQGLSAAGAEPGTVQVRYGDLSFLRNMAQRAPLTGVDTNQYSEVMCRIMAVQERYLIATVGLPSPQQEPAPSVAEPAKCVCGDGKNPVCRKNFAAGTHGWIDACINSMSDGTMCGHPRACHAEPKPANKEDGK